jgi:AcrR family transcriptional regulator
VATTRDAVQSAHSPAAGTSYAKLKPGPSQPAQEVAAHQRARLRAAMVELVEERGYTAVRIRQLVGLACVSTHTFYEHFTGKEDLLLCVYERFIERVRRRMLAAQRMEAEPRAWLRRAIDAVCCEVASEPRAARVALLEAPGAGRQALARMRWADRTLEATLIEHFVAGEDPVVLPPLVARGIVAGATHVMRTRLRAGRERELPGLAGQLAEWACVCAVAGAAPAPGGLIPLAPSGRALAGTYWVSGECEPLLTAAWKLAMREGYQGLSVPRVRAAAGVPRRSFEAHFERVEDCFLAACEQRARLTLAAAGREGRARGGSWPAGIYRAVSLLCTRIASQPDAAKLALIEALAVGPQGLALWERLIESTAANLRTSAPAGQWSGELAVSASASTAAVWGVVCDHVATKRACHLPGVAPTLSLMVLAPALGADGAAETIRSEREHMSVCAGVSRFAALGG